MSTQNESANVCVHCERRFTPKVAHPVKCFFCGGKWPLGRPDGGGRPKEIQTTRDEQQTPWRGWWRG